MPKVSVLVPIFNVEKYLEQCLDSIVNQTLTDIEIICINDGSTDKSLNIIKKYAKKDPRVIVVNKKNSGYGDSMNRGIQKATGAYVGIVESDDWIELDAFEKLYALADEHDADVVKGNYYNYYTTPSKAAINGTVTQLVNPDNTGKLIDPRYNHDILYQRPAIWAGIYKKSFLVDNKISFLPSAGASYQDTGFNFKVWSSARRAVFTSDAFLHYRQDNEASSVHNPGKVFCVADEFAEIENYLKKHKLMEYFGEVMRVAKWGAYAWNIDRLKADLAVDFINHASNEYKRDYKSGVFNFENCDPNQVRAISEIIHSPEMTIKRKYAAEEALVTAIMPAYNVERFISTSIESVLNQTLKQIEIIVIDDGSFDETPDILESYFNLDARITIINTQNHGQAAARNIGIERAHAPYISFIDADDYYELDALKNLHTLAIESDADVTAGSMRIIYKDKKYTAIEKNNDKQYYMTKFRGVQTIDSHILKRMDVSPCNKLFKKQIIDEYVLLFPNGLRYEDAYFFNAYAMLAQTIAFLPQDLYVYNYVRRQDSTMAETFSKETAVAYDHLEIAISLYDFMVVNNLVSKYGAYFIDIFIEYFQFATRWTHTSQHQRIYDRVSGFIGHNQATLQTISPETVERLRALLPVSEVNVPVRFNPARVAGGKMKRGVKRTLQPVVSKFSYNYKSQKRILESIEDLKYRLQDAEDRRIKSEKVLSAKINDLEHKLTRSKK